MNKIEKYGDCSFCGGHVSEKLVQKVCSKKGRLIAVIDNVPAGVCDQCGERYYKSRIAEKIELKLADIGKSRRHIQLPISDFAA